MSKLEGNIKRFIRQNNVIHKKETAQKYESDFLKRFDVIMGKQMIPLISCLDSNPDVIKAIDLTLKYIQEILNLIPPQDLKKRRIYYELLFTLNQRIKRNLARMMYETFKWEESGKGDYKNYKTRKKNLSSKELAYVEEKMADMPRKFKSPDDLEKCTPTEFREWINNIMQDCFDRLFGVWNGMLGEFEEYRVAFFKEISKIVSQRMVGERRDLPKEAERVYRYVLQYLKYTAQKEVDKRKLKIQIKDCCWSREWVEQLHYTEFKQVCIRCEIPQDKDSLPSCIAEYVPFSIEQKRYLGGSKEFEDTLRKILKEMKQSYFKN